MLSVNRLAASICRNMIDEASELDIKCTLFKNGAHLIDSGNRVKGGVQAGLYVTEICLGGVGDACLKWMDIEGMKLPAVQVMTDFPVLSLLCQASGGYREAMEGWINFTAGSYRAIASGPARGLVHEPKKLFEMIGYKDSADEAVVVLQSEQYPNERVANVLAARCNVNPENLYVVLSPLSSLSGTIQVTGRSVENAMVKFNTLKYSVNTVKHAFGMAPLPPPNSSTIVPDDMLSYASVVHLYVLPNDNENSEEMAKRMPSQNSKSYGKSFTALIREHGGLRGIDINLFAPAEVCINNMKTGEFHHYGKVNGSLIKKWIKRTTK